MAKQNHTAEEIVAFIRGLDKIGRILAEMTLEQFKCNGCRSVVISCDCGEDE